MSWVWVGWVIFIAVSFAVFEGYALKTGRNTLSRTVWIVSKNFPPFPWIVGVLVGFLAAHFWWGGIVCFAPVTSIEAPRYVDNMPVFEMPHEIDCAKRDCFIFIRGENQ